MPQMKCSNCGGYSAIGCFIEGCPNSGKMSEERGTPLIIGSESAGFPTIEMLADLSRTTVSYQGPSLVEEAVRCWRQLAAAQAKIARLKGACVNAQDQLLLQSRLLDRRGRMGELRHRARQQEQRHADPEQDLEVERGHLELEVIEMNNAEIAASVAKALGLTDYNELCWVTKAGINGHGLRKDGSNLIDEYWQVRCRNWLYSHGYSLLTSAVLGEAWLTDEPDGDVVQIECFSSEFCARAIHELMLTDKPAAAPASS